MKYFCDKDVCERQSFERKGDKPLLVVKPRTVGFLAKYSGKRFQNIVEKLSRLFYSIKLKLHKLLTITCYLILVRSALLTNLKDKIIADFSMNALRWFLTFAFLLTPN